MQTISFEWAVFIFVKEYRKQRFCEIARILNVDGYPGSDNFGHAGRPGEFGGSAEGSGGTKDSGITLGISESKENHPQKKQVNVSICRNIFPVSWL